ncbi:MAG: alpha/beta-type small acid-soluble spore protein [Defluviitaleaceae bacterium]|nr:alpha/beta-type small acid-soluble spore protein [Defluviitaleaceae bacterium]
MKPTAKPTENDIMKYEIAKELGLMDKVNATGWKSLTAKESGRLGGILARRKKQARIDDQDGQ